MLGPALTFLVLFLQGPYSPAASSCPAPLSPDGPVVRPSGTAFCLGPGHTPTAVRSFDWKVQLHSNPSPRVLFTWKNDSRLHHARWNAGDYNRLNFSIKELRLLLKAARPDDSGTYSLEVNLENGTVRTHRFHVSVLDPVGKPELQLLEQTAALGNGKCRVTLNCSASGGGDVTYTWYRGGEWIPTPRSPFRLEEQIDANGWHVYTCNVSNPVSWAHQSLQLGQGCGSAPQRNASLSELGLLPLLTIIVVLILTLLGTLTGICVWRRGRKPAEPGPEESLTVYEDVNHPPGRSGQTLGKKRLCLAEVLGESSPERGGGSSRTPLGKGTLSTPWSCPSLPLPQHKKLQLPCIRWCCPQGRLDLRRGATALPSMKGLERYNPELNTLLDSTPGAEELFCIIPGATAGLPCVRTQRLFWESVQWMTPYEST